METFKEFVARRKAEIKEEADIMYSICTPPKLVIINVGDDPASKVYIKGKLTDCEEVGIQTELKHFDLDELYNSSEHKIPIDPIRQYIRACNADSSVTGIILQLPLPDELKKYEKYLTNLIAPEKDVDGFTKEAYVNPATPQGIIDYLTEQKFDFTNKNAVVIGRSEIVGRPMAKLLLDNNCNVVQLHSKTSEENKRLFLKNADLIVTAVGKTNIIDASYELKPTAWIIDVGMNRDEEGKLIGDCARNLPVEFQSPVPGGVGLTTRLALITNLLNLYILEDVLDD